VVEESGWRWRWWLRERGGRGGEGAVMAELRVEEECGVEWVCRRRMRVMAVVWLLEMTRRRGRRRREDGWWRE